MNLSPNELHIPDGFLSLTVSIIFWIFTVIIIAIAVNFGQKSLKQKQIPLMGIMAAFIFAAQMINFPVAGGTSGHLLGGALAAIILGPWAGMLVMTCVVGLQALLFQDGGLLVMGANIFNMGLLTSLIGFGLYAITYKLNDKAQAGVIGFAAWLSVMASALATAVQIWLSGTSPARIIFPAMLSIHALIGIGEALISVSAYSFIKQVRPDLLKMQTHQNTSNTGWIIVGSLISLGVVLLSPFASTRPDGLEKVATELNFIYLAQEHPFKIFSDYLIPSMGESIISTILTGILGILIVGGVSYLIGKLIKNPSS